MYKFRNTLTTSVHTLLRAPALFAAGALLFIVAPLMGQSAAAPTVKPASAITKAEIASPDAPPALTLSPAVVIVKGQPGQTVTQKLTLTNTTPLTLAFDVEAEDVITKEGKRTFIPAGELPNSIAATAVFSRKMVDLSPNSSAEVTVTFTVPPAVSHRAVVAVFKGTTRVQADSKASVGMTASLGALITFTITDKFSFEASQLRVSPQSGAANAAFELDLANNGDEPVIPEGVAAVINGSGKLVGKATFGSQRLLPGEKLPFRADYPSLLKPGSYKLLATFEFGGKTVTASQDFAVQ